MKSIITLAVTFFFVLNLNAQNLTLTPGNQAKLNLPRLTYDQILAIPSPESGSIVYDLTTNCIRYYNGTKWLCTDQKSSDFSATSLSAWKISETDPGNGFQSNSIKVDNQGNIYVAGIFNDYFKVNGTTYAGLGYGDVFIVKYNSTGVAQWVKTAGNHDTYSNAVGIVLDNQGHVFVVGTFFRALNLDGVSITANNSSGDVFLCKLSATDGSVQALKAIGGSNYDNCSEIFIDNQSNLYITGTFVGNCNFDALSISGTDNNDIYIAKCNANLQFQWVNKITGVSIDESGGLCGDNAGNIYLTGSIASDATFAPGITSSPGMKTLFVAKYNASNGNYIWHRMPNNAGFMNYGRFIVADSESNVYVGGYFFGSLVLDPFQLSTNANASDLFIAKISKDGQWQWAHQSSSSDSYDTELFNDMKINAYDELFLVCRTSFSKTFGFVDKRYTGHNFVFKFDKNGGVKGGNVIQTSMNQTVQSIAFKGYYHFLTGYFNGSISFGNISLSSGTNNGFVAKFVE